MLPTTNFFKFANDYITTKNKMARHQKQILLLPTFVMKFL